MKEEFQVITENKAETAILVGIITQDQDERKTNEYLDELEFLADTAGVCVKRRITQTPAVSARNSSSSRYSFVLRSS